MTSRLTDEQWRIVLELSAAIADLPDSEQLVYVESASSDPDVIREVLTLVREFLPPDAPVRIGARVGRFLITEYIGRGGMGEVYAARDTELERFVALKFLNPDVAGRQKAGERFVREARTASALNHPNIVTIYEVIRSEPAIAIVMEFVDGRPLREFCESPLAIPKVASIGRQIAQALEAAHGAGVIHCDIKPENVILKPDGGLKVLDFGLARWVTPESFAPSSASHSGLIAGTWRYMSPEQTRGEPVTSATDVFSLGLVLYELSTGRHPFAAPSAFDVMQAIVTKEPAKASGLNPAIPPVLDTLIAAMLAKSPGARPAIEEVGRVLSEVEAGSPSEPLPTRHRKLAIGIAAALVVLLAGAAWMWRAQIGLAQPSFYQVTTLVVENRATAAAISPDGRLTAYANVDGVYIRVGQSGETTPLRLPNDLVVDKLAWFSDETRLLASGFSPQTNVAAIWAIPITGAPPRQVRTEAEQGVPSPDGQHIAFMLPDESSIWVMDADGSQARAVVSGPGEDTFPLVFWSADGRRLSFQRRHYSRQQDLGFVMLDRYYEHSYESVELDSLKVTARAPNLWIESAAMLPDNRLLFLRWQAPGEDLANQLWEVKTEAKTGAFRGSPFKVAGPVKAGEDHIYGMTATDDGRQVMVLRRSDQKSVFVAGFESSPPRLTGTRRLTLDARPSYPHAWTADSRAVIFESDRNGSWDLFKQRLDQRTPETLVATPSRWEVLPQLSPDGRWVLYAAGSPGGSPGPYTLMRVPVEGGVPQEVPIGGNLEEFRCSVNRAGRCILRITTDRRYFDFFDLDPVKGKGRELARTNWRPFIAYSWDVSPDGSEAAIPNRDLHSARIRVVPLTGNGKQETEVVAPGLRNLSGVTWAADGSGWFAATGSPLGNRLMFISRTGRWHPLGDIQGWGVPSPDSRRLAFVNPIIATNAWMIDMRTQTPSK
jgi:serine/threonine protein kinase/Tol biopolymer transport system component